MDLTLFSKKDLLLEEVKKINKIHPYPYLKPEHFLKMLEQIKSLDSVEDVKVKAYPSYGYVYIFTHPLSLYGTVLGKYEIRIYIGKGTSPPFIGEIKNLTHTIKRDIQDENWDHPYVCETAVCFGNCNSQIYYTTNLFEKTVLAIDFLQTCKVVWPREDGIEEINHIYEMFRKDAPIIEAKLKEGN